MIKEKLQNLMVQHELQIEQTKYGDSFLHLFWYCKYEQSKQLDSIQFALFLLQLS